jgi:tRNA dimethylallyltransferase
LEWLQNEVKKRDEIYYNSLDKSNHTRLLRSLEILMLTNEKISETIANNKTNKLTYESHCYMLDMPRNDLYDIINTRTDKMIAAGLIEEARALHPLKDLKALSTVGYKELFECFDGITTEQQAIENIKQHTRNYAKRQLTWFRNKGNYHLFNKAIFNKTHKTSL